MKSLAYAAAALTFAIGFAGSPANAADAPDAQKVETSIIAVHNASGTVQLSNGMVLDQSRVIRSATLRHLYETEGAQQLQRKFPTGEIRYLADGAKA